MLPLGSEYTIDSPRDGLSRSIFCSAIAKPSRCSPHKAIFDEDSLTFTYFTTTFFPFTMYMP